MALAEGISANRMSQGRDGDVVLGDDWVAPESTVEKEMRGRRERRRLTPLRRSPLTRKIITFNLIALCFMVAGILYLNSPRENYVQQRLDALRSEATLLGAVFAAQMPTGAPVNLVTQDGLDVQEILDGTALREGVRVDVFDQNASPIARADGDLAAPLPTRATPLTDAMNWIWSKVSGEEAIDPGAGADVRIAGFAEALLDRQSSTAATAVLAEAEFASGLVLDQSGRAIGAIILSQSTADVDQLVLAQHERILQLFLVAIVVSVGLSVVLASTISNPLSDLAAAAELGRDGDDRQVNPGRVRIPDLTARPDEIGRLSTALRGMVGALYERIDSNEQFAADVAHEIKNPLASLRSAVGSLRMVKREDHRTKLLDVIEHDVRRLDRLVSDISNASRLDAELVKEEEERFNLVSMISNLAQYLGDDAKGKGIDFISDLPTKPIEIMGLEARLAQVFVNLITNAISFCEDGDAIRVWVRKRQNRVLVVVEDTGPGIPDQALNKIFNRFYSERPHEDFGNNSGLGLAISKQIVEAHGGVIWAENIRPTEADITSDPLGARFVVGLPV